MTGDKGGRDPWAPPESLDDFYRNWGNFWTDGETDWNELKENPIFLRWQASHPGQGIQEFKDAWYGNYNRLTGRAGDNSAGAGNFDFSKYDAGSYSGLAPWASALLQRYMGKYGESAFSGLEDALGNLDNAGKFINQSRVAQNRQYTRDIAAPTMSAVGSAVGQAAGKGVLGSSISNSWMGRIGQQMAQGAAQQQNASNIWAANANLGMLGTRANAYQNYAGLMQNMLGLGQESRSWNPASPWGAGLGWAPPANGTDRTKS